MPLDAFADSARSATGNSTVWTTVAVAAATFLLTAGLTLLVQLYIVPRVETRKRRDDRWERNVLELGELLTTQVGRLAQEARSAQDMARFLHRDLEGVAGVDQEQLERNRRESGLKARQATQEYQDLVKTRVDWLEDRIRSFASPGPRIIGEFDSAARAHWLAAMDLSYVLHEHDNRTDEVFNNQWSHESETRRALIKQVKRLADLPHPPRAQRSPRDYHDLLGGPDPGPRPG